MLAVVRGMRTDAAMRISGYLWGEVGLFLGEIGRISGEKRPNCGETGCKMSDRSKEATKWIASTPNTVAGSVKAVHMIINKRMFDVVQYQKKLKPPAGASNPAEYTQEYIYVLGDIWPDSLDKSCLVISGDTREWYVSGWWQKNTHILSHDVSTFHPFGSNFILCPWTIEGEKIDQYEHKPYKRVPALFFPE